MAASTAEIKAHGIVLREAAFAHGYTGPPVFVCECGHLDERHDNDEMCLDCSCQEWVAAHV